MGVGTTGKLSTGLGTRCAAVKEVADPFRQRRCRVSRYPETTQGDGGIRRFRDTISCNALDRVAVGDGGLQAGEKVGQVGAHGRGTARSWGAALGRARALLRSSAPHRVVFHTEVLVFHTTVLMLARLRSAAVLGIDAYLVDVETDSAPRGEQRSGPSTGVPTPAEPHAR